MEPQTSVTWLSYYFATSVLFHRLFVNEWHFLSMTQGTGLLGSRALYKENGQSQKVHLFVGRLFCDRNFNKNPNSFPTCSNQSRDYPKAQFILEAPLCLYLVHYWNKLSKFWPLSGVGFSNANNKIPRNLWDRFLEIRKQAKISLIIK